MIEFCEYGTWKGLPLYQCVLCPFSTLDREDFIKHVEAKHLGAGYEKVITYRCQECSFESDDEQKVKDHVHLKHRILPEPPQEPQKYDRFGNPTGAPAVSEVTQEDTDNGEDDTNEDDD